MIRALHILFSGLLIANFAAQILAAQKASDADYRVEGRVTDWVTGNAIVAATVAAEDSHKHSYPTLTKTDGSYRLEHLPREHKLTLSCSQLGYSPNPMQSVVTLRSGVGKWDTRLFQENGDAPYLKAAAERLASLTGPDSITEAKFVADNVDAGSKKIIAAELQQKMRTEGRNSDLSQIAAVFQTSAGQVQVAVGVHAVDGTVKKLDAGTKIVVVETKDGTEHSFHYGSDVTVAGGKDTKKGAVDAAHGVEEGSRVAVHYTVVEGKEKAHEIDNIGGDGLKATDGTVSHIDRGAKTIAVKTADGGEETFHLTDRAAKDTGKDVAEGADKSEKVTVYYTEKAGVKTAHFIKSIF
jgi:Carboxypeptidase regulatory-like domain